MNEESTSGASQTDWARVDAMRDEDIDLSDIPEVTEEQMARAKMRIAGKPIVKGKVRINIFLDAEVVAYFKTKAGGRGYQTLINEALKANIRDHELETILRLLIRKESAS